MRGLTSRPHSCYTNSQETCVTFSWTCRQTPVASPHKDRNSSVWSHEETRARASAVNQTSLKHLERIFCSGPKESLLPLEAHLPRQTVDQILPELSPLCFLRFCFPLKPPSISIKRQVLRRADFSFAVDNKSAFPWQGLERKTRDEQCCHDKPEVTAVEREEAAFDCVVSFFLPRWMVLHMWSQSKRSHFKLPGSWTHSVNTWPYMTSGERAKRWLTLSVAARLLCAYRKTFDQKWAAWTINKDAFIPSFCKSSFEFFHKTGGFVAASATVVCTGSGRGVKQTHLL